MGRSHLKDVNGVTSLMYACLYWDIPNKTYEVLMQHKADLKIRSVKFIQITHKSGTTKDEVLFTTASKAKHTAHQFTRDYCG